MILWAYTYFRGIPYSRKVWQGKGWQIDSFQAFDERKFGELIDQPIDY